MTDTDTDTDTRERSLAEAAVETVDSTPVVTPSDFSMASFLEGVRPTRRSVQLFPHAHLIAQLEQLAAQIDAADQGEDVNALIDQFERTKAQFRDGVWFTVEKRSSEWIDHFRDTTAKRLGMKKVREDKDAEPALSPADELTVSIHQLAEQIVVPAGITHADLRRLVDTNEGEANKLMYAMIQVNTKLAQGAEVLTRDFSVRRSAPTST